MLLTESAPSTRSISTPQGSPATVGVGIGELQRVRGISVRNAVGHHRDELLPHAVPARPAPGAHLLLGIGMPQPQDMTDFVAGGQARTVAEHMRNRREVVVEVHCTVRLVSAQVGPPANHADTARVGSVDHGDVRAVLADQIHRRLRRNFIEFAGVVHGRLDDAHQPEVQVEPAVPVYLVGERHHVADAGGGIAGCRDRGSRGCTSPARRWWTCPAWSRDREGRSPSGVRLTSPTPSPSESTSRLASPVAMD